MATSFFSRFPGMYTVIFVKQKEIGNISKFTANSGEFCVEKSQSNIRKELQTRVVDFCFPASNIKLFI